ncbi:MAG: TVP38/TMEM64 family protein [Nitrospirota bacterium]|nr:MAG: TVP38/TMEM64 family protein [Nitrospirota bacterium]
MKSKVPVKIVLFAFLIAVLFLSQLVWDIASYFKPEAVKGVLESAGVFAPAIYMLIMAAAIVVSPIPSLPLDIAAGMVFGPVLGTLYSLVGATAGAMASFSIARYLGSEFVERKISGHIIFCRRCSDRLMTRVVFFSRLLPFVSFDVVSYGAGLTNMSLTKFAVATFLGMIPLTFVYNYFGATLAFSGPTVVILGLVMVSMFFIIPRWIEKKDPFKLKAHFEHDH